MQNDVTCAVIIKSQGSLLLAHSTNSPWTHWNFPKGIADPGEEHVDAACRELLEETGIRLDINQLIDLGQFAYLPGKDIHLYLFETDEIIDTTKLICESTFFCSKKQIDRPECDGFRMVPFDKLPVYFFPSIAELYFSKLQDKVEK